MKASQETGARFGELHPPAAILAVEDVFKIYMEGNSTEGNSETVALRGASMQIMRGEFVALLGRSGSGKTTLLNLIAGIDRPSAGRIWVDGNDMTRMDRDAQANIRRRDLGFVFQSNNMIPFLSARENVELPLHLAKVAGGVARQRASELLSLVGLTARQRHRAGQLSGGEAQRVGIASALAAQPKLVLADELTGELDSSTTKAILDLIVRINQQQGTAFLVVTHNLMVAKRAHRILHVRDGVVEEGTRG